MPTAAHMRASALPTTTPPNPAASAAASPPPPPELVHENFTCDTRDHEDHTFCGMMFDVKCEVEMDASAPLEQSRPHTHPHPYHPDPPHTPPTPPPTPDPHPHSHSRPRPHSQSARPVEYIEVHSVWVRGALGPMTVWTTPDSHKGKEEEASEWERVYAGQVSSSHGRGRVWLGPGLEP